MLETPRVSLRPLAVADVVAMATVLADPSLYTHTGGSPPTLAELTARYERQVRGSPDPDERWWNWIVRLVDDGDAIGFVQATARGATARLAWVVGVAHQGHGYARESVGMARDLLVREGVVGFDALVHPDNLASQRVAAAVGMAPTDDVVDGEVRWRTSRLGPARERAIKR